ncbi:MAG: flagellar assembly peptidoglycan hydrolase FlgJ [Gammaproteobacteria bacterium]|nr:flagellar assembly peptidoglycan hydrolase FlgJ [Gammaproteobacteria bacterium]
MLQSTPPDLYMNMAQFSEMKLAARQDSRAASRSAAQQFEGLFIQMMLKNMRSAAKMDESMHSSNMDFYTDMYDKQISMMLSQQGGIGIADLLEKQLNRFLPEGQSTAEKGGKDLPVYRLSVKATSSLPLPVMSYQATNPAVAAYELNETEVAPEVPAQGSVQSLQSQTVEPFYGWDQASSFVSDLWPHAERAAERLGVSAQVLVAQSALETGWGRHTMRKADGSVAFNLFGIKASRGWAGQSVVHNTLEFRGGAMQQEAARFRAYDSVGEALDDYVDFVKGHSRYQRALDNAGNDAQYIRELHQAGYATDPHYADKILGIMKGQTFNDALASLEISNRMVG